MTIPAKITEAILRFRGNVKRMTHDEQNKHDSYSYVSIDKYYEQVAPIATKAGLAWRGREVSFDMVPGMGARGDRTYVKVTFSYDLMADGETAEDYTRITILSPISGPQTTGQVYSYADKVLMRTLGCVSTGEQDADALPTEEVRSTPVKDDPIMGAASTLPDHDPITGEIKDTGLSLDDPAPVQSGPNADIIMKEKDGLPILDTRKIGEAEVALVEKIFERYIKEVKTKPKLRDWHAENLAAMEKIKKIDPSSAGRIKALFNAHNSTLTK